MTFGQEICKGLANGSEFTRGQRVSLRLIYKKVTTTSSRERVVRRCDGRGRAQDKHDPVEQLAGVCWVSYLRRRNAHGCAPVVVGLFR